MYAILENEEQKDLFFFIKQHNIIVSNSKLSQNNKKKQLKNLYAEAYKEKHYSFICENVTLFYKNDYSFEMKDIELLHYLVRSNLRTENFNKNEKLLKHVKMIKGNTYFIKAIHHNLAISLIKNKKFKTATELLCKIKNKNIYHLLDLAYAYMKIKKTEEAKNIYIKMINKNKNEAKLLGYFSLGELALELDDDILLKKCYDNSVLLFSNNFENDFRSTRLFLLYKFSKKLGLKLARKYLELAINSDAREPEDIYQKKLALKEWEVTM